MLYEKDTREFGNTTAEKFELINGKANDKDRMWLFTRETEEGYAYSCGFLFDKDGKLIPTDYYAFCFFPTKKDTNLNFIINAPFLLTDSREGIKATDKHNIRMISLLADLAADCFVYLRDIGLENDKMIIDDRLKEASDLVDKVDELFRNSRENIENDFCNAAGLQISHESVVVKLLKKLMHDKHEWIDYFIYELDYGRNYEPGMIKEADGTNIDLSSAEALYGYLKSYCENKRGE